MRSRSLMILAALVVAVGAFIFFVERHAPTTEERLERAGRVFPDLDPETVVEVDLFSEHGPVRLVRYGDDWRLVEPLDYPADAAAVRGLIDAVAGLDAERELSLDDVGLEAYGLDEPQLDLALVDSDGHRFGFAVGAETPLEANRAIHLDGTDDIVICSGGFVASLDRDVDGWRSRDVVEIFENDLAGVEITSAEDRIVVARRDQRWWLSEPVADLADRDQMQSLVSELNGLRVSEFLPPDAAPAELGLEPPEYTVTLTPTGDDPAVTLELSAPADDGSGIESLVCRRDGTDLFRIPASIRTRLAKAPVLWRSAKVWPFPTWDVTGLEIAAGDELVELQQEAGLWQSDDGAEVDAAAVRRRLTALADLEAREHDLLVPPTAVAGSVTLALDGDEPGPTFTFYEPIEEGGHSAVTVSTRDDVMGVDTAVVENILGDLDALRAPLEESEPEG